MAIDLNRRELLHRLGWSALSVGLLQGCQGEPVDPERGDKGAGDDADTYPDSGRAAEYPDSGGDVDYPDHSWGARQEAYSDYWDVTFFRICDDDWCCPYWDYWDLQAQPYDDACLERDGPVRYVDYCDVYCDAYCDYYSDMYEDAG